MYQPSSKRLNTKRRHIFFACKSLITIYIYLRSLNFRIWLYFFFDFLNYSIIIIFFVNSGGDLTFNDNRQNIRFNKSGSRFFFLQIYNDYDYLLFDLNGFGRS